MRLNEEPSRRTRARTYYDILGVPTGAGVNHIRDSYRLLTKKTSITDLAYQALTDPEKRREYDAYLGQSVPLAQGESEVEPDWGVRGREKCSCGKILELDDEWLCRECWGRLNYFVVFDMFGGHVLHEDHVYAEPDPDGNQSEQQAEQPAFCTVYGPFTIEEAEDFLRERNELRGSR
jgi:curved DNA-binding protein CbpA